MMQPNLLLSLPITPIAAIIEGIEERAQNKEQEQEEAEEEIYRTYAWS